MYTEENGIFSRIKTLFSVGRSEENEIATEETGVVESLDAASRQNHPDDEAIIFEEPKSRVSDESVTEKEITLRTVEVTAPKYVLSEEKDLDIRFATKFIAAEGKFVYCETVQDAIGQISALKEEMGWAHVFAWENEIKDAFCNVGFQKGAIGFTIENSDAAVSLCESLVAADGNIVLNSKQASRRRLECFPKTHIILTDVAHLVRDEAAALERFSVLHKGELPSIIKLGSCNSGHFYDKQRLILNADGTEDIYVFLVDEIIPPSLRP